MNKKKNVDILHIANLCTYLWHLTDICWIDDKNSHLKHVYVHEKCKVSDFKFAKVMQQHT